MRTVTQSLLAWFGGTAVGAALSLPGIAVGAVVVVVVVAVIIERRFAKTG